MLYTIGNIHGYGKLLEIMLKKVNFKEEKDQLVILGGLIDYGPWSIETVNLCMRLKEKGAIILRGELEERYLEAYKNRSLEKIAGNINSMVYFYEDNPDIRNIHLSFFRKMDSHYRINDYLFTPRKIYSNTKETNIYGEEPVPYVLFHEKQIGIDLGAGRMKDGKLALVNLEKQSYIEVSTILNG